VFAGKQFAAAGNAGLHFIGNQENSVRVAQGPQAAQEAERRRNM
jgi:hypothetical protein